MFTFADARWRTAARRVAVPVIAAGTFLAMVSTPASAGSWSYNLKTTDGHPGGQTWGTVSYTGNGCYTTRIRGTVKDIEADGWGVIVLASGNGCNGGSSLGKEIGYVGGNGKSKNYDTGNIRNVKNVTVTVCLYKNGYAYHGCRDA
ncbi:hypothetical protein ACGV4K_08355 [Streptomyces sp. WAC8370]|uniref:hypothetical protein n=1 Tax=Streptomyces sp. WAC8370 TaxID=3351348 RepID=UPI003F7B2218